MYVSMPKFSAYAISHTHILHDMWLSESSSFIPFQWSPYDDYKMKMCYFIEWEQTYRYQPRMTAIRAR